MKIFETNFIYDWKAEGLVFMAL